MKRSRLFCCVALGGALALPAQKLPLSADPGRMVHLVDLGPLLATPGEPDDEVEPPPAPRLEQGGGDPLQPLAAALRPFLQPPLGPGDDLRVLAGRWLTLVGSAEQSASLERLVQTAMAHKLVPIGLTIHIWQVPDVEFQRSLRSRFTPLDGDDEARLTTTVAKLEADDWEAAVAKAAAHEVVAPQLSVLPLQQATFAVKSQSSFVRDFAVVHQGPQVIAEPIVDMVWDGLEVDVTATFLPGGDFGLCCSVLQQQVAKPFPELTTTLPGLPTPVKVQVPRVASTRLEDRGRVAPGGLRGFATQGADGMWLVTTVRPIAGG